MNSNLSARNAWKCLGAIFLLYLALGVFLAVFVAFVPTGREWVSEHRSLKTIILSAGDILLLLVPTLWFARIQSFSEFKTTFRLNSPPNKKVWLGIACAVGIQGMIWIAARLGIPVQGIAMPNSASIGLSEKFLYFLPFLLAPFWEEIVMRGFFYASFRKSYSVASSIIFVVGITALTHLGQFFGSITGAIGLSAFVLVLCWQMERTNTLWNCVLTHLVANLIFVGEALLVPKS